MLLSSKVSNRLRRKVTWKKQKTFSSKLDPLLSFLSPDQLGFVSAAWEDASWFSGLGVTTCRAGSHGRVAFITSGSIDGKPRRSLRLEAIETWTVSAVQSNSFFGSLGQGRVLQINFSFYFDFNVFDMEQTSAGLRSPTSLTTVDRCIHFLLISRKKLS